MKPIFGLRTLRFMDNWMIHIITTIMQQVNLESCGYLTSCLFDYWITSSSSCFLWCRLHFQLLVKLYIPFASCLYRTFNCFYGLTFNCCSWWPEVSCSSSSYSRLSWPFTVAVTVTITVCVMQQWLENKSQGHSNPIWNSGKHMIWDYGT